jgi:transposase
MLTGTECRKASIDLDQSLGEGPFLKDIFFAPENVGSLQGDSLSTGDRTMLGSISKRGNRYLRSLFVQAAWLQCPADASQIRATVTGTEERLPRCGGELPRRCNARP